MLAGGGHWSCSETAGTIDDGGRGDGNNVTNRKKEKRKKLTESAAMKKGRRFIAQSQSMKIVRPASNCKEVSIRHRPPSVWYIKILLRICLSRAVLASPQLAVTATIAQTSAENASSLWPCSCISSWALLYIDNDRRHVLNTNMCAKWGE